MALIISAVVVILAMGTYIYLLSRAGKKWKKKAKLLQVRFSIRH